MDEQHVISTKRVEKHVESPGFSLNRSWLEKRSIEDLRTNLFSFFLLFKSSSFPFSLCSFDMTMLPQLQLRMMSILEMRKWPKFTVNIHVSSLKSSLKCALIILLLIVAQDIQMMLFVGFGYLMCFLRRFGYSAIVQTMLVIVVTTEWAILVQGFSRMADGTETDSIIRLSWAGVMEGCIAAVTVLVSYGVLIGKISPLQSIVMA